MVDATSVPACVMNETVQKYEPTLDDTFFIIPSGDYQRLIFTGMKLRDREETHLNDFRNYLKTNNLEIPAGYDDESMLILRFLQKLHWDYKKAHAAIMENHEWKSKVNLTLTDPILAEFKKGWIYCYKRDKSMRPVMIVSVRKLIDANVGLEMAVDVADVFLDYVIKNTMVPGKVENWTAIFDMRDVGVTELPSKHMQNLVKSMSKNYCGRMFKFFLTDCNWLVRSMMYCVHKFVDEFTQRKLLTFADDYQKDLHEIVAKESLEKKYGGLLEDKKSDFWPPQLN